MKFQKKFKFKSKIGKNINIKNKNLSKSLIQKITKIITKTITANNQTRHITILNFQGKRQKPTETLYQVLHNQVSSRKVDFIEKN